MLTRNQILKQTGLKSEVVKVPEWGGEVTVRELTGRERDIWEATVMDQSGPDIKMNMKNARALLAALSITDGEGVKLFTTDDVDALGELSCSALDRVFGAAMRVSGLTREDMDELAGN